MGKFKVQIYLDPDIIKFMMDLEKEQRLKNLSQTINYFIKTSIDKLSDYHTVKTVYQAQIDRMKNRIIQLEHELKLKKEVKKDGDNNKKHHPE